MLKSHMMYYCKVDNYLSDNKIVKTTYMRKDMGGTARHRKAVLRF